MVFLHGGGWAWGDRTQSFGGADVYRNIGRFLASQGIGAAVIGCRLVWTVDWREQLGDVGRAVAWVQGHIAERGGQANRLFLLGHSAGAQLGGDGWRVNPAWLASGTRRAIISYRLVWAVDWHDQLGDVGGRGLGLATATACAGWRR